MLTGYLIIFVLFIIGLTAFLRHTSLSYEVFYAFHSLVIVLYFVSIMHTLDQAARGGAKVRSQNFKWFTAPLLYYICDFAMLYINQRFSTRVQSFNIMKGKGQYQMAKLKLKRPTLFHFKPGQYAFLKTPQVDGFWHPFSIASDPDSTDLEFYIEVCGDGSWTKKLCNVIKNVGDYGNLEIEIMGPYGTGIVNRGEYSAVVAVGSGTGIVPILSIFKQHVNQLLLLDPVTCLDAQCNRQIKIMNITQAQEERARTVFQHLLSCFITKEKSKHQLPKADLKTARVRQSLHQMSCRDISSNPVARGGSEKDKRKAILSATRSVYARVLIACLTGYGAVVIGLFLSWTTISIKPYKYMKETLMVSVGVYEGIFACLSLFVWDSISLATFIDVVINISNPVLGWHLISQYEVNKSLSRANIAAKTCMLIYVTLRLWWRAISTTKIDAALAGDKAVPILDRLEVIWVTKSSKLVSSLLPDLTQEFNRLAGKWGEHADEGKNMKYSGMIFMLPSLKKSFFSFCLDN